MDPDTFNLEMLLQQRIRIQNDEDPGDDLFEMSPPTTPVASRPTSPASMMVDLSEEEVNEVDGGSEKLSRGDRRKGRNKQQSRKNGQKRRRVEKKLTQTGPEVREGAALKHANNAQILFSTTSASNGSVSQTGYTGKPKTGETLGKATLKALIKKGYQLVKWDGK